MKLIVLIITILTHKCFCQNIDYFFRNINDEVIKFNAKAAEIAWESTINPDNPDLPGKSAVLQERKIYWQDAICDRLKALKEFHLLNNTQGRLAYLLCRGPKYTFEETRVTSRLYEELQSIYNEAKICIPTNYFTSKDNISMIENTIKVYLYAKRAITNSLLSSQNHKFFLCLEGEKDFEILMKFSKSEMVLKWVWSIWRELVGPPMKNPYIRMIEIENKAAKRNSYADLGATWRDELEVPNLRQLCRELYSNIKPLYELLHGIVRFHLRRLYGASVPERGPIPAHLLGDLWSQNWESLTDIITEDNIDLDKSIKSLNWSADHMLRRADDFYQSLSLPAMPDTFWRKSVLKKGNGKTRCHGAAADMYRRGDYRLIYCSGQSLEDFYVLHHELGHIHYYMAYEDQPGIYRQGANTAIHESIGDTIMLGVITPQHLHRLGLVNDSILYTKNNPDGLEENFINYNENEKAEIDYTHRSPGGIIFNFKIINEKNNAANKLLVDYLKNDIPNTNKSNENIGKINMTVDELLLLKQALNKIPQIPFALLLDEYRWRYFEGSIDEDMLNGEFWKMAFEFQGIAPPEVRDEKYFDAGSKFHIPDNTPYIRYFLASFLRHQLFEVLCKAAVFGRTNVTEPLPKTITMHRCDIYGSKTAGKLLREMMSKGSSQHWRVNLYRTFGIRGISAKPLMRYYSTLYNVLLDYVQKNDIPIGW